MKKLLLAATASCFLSQSAAFAIPEATHEKCVNAADYKGCVEANHSSKAEEEAITGILWDSAKWLNKNTVQIKVYRMRGGGLWLGNSMRLSKMTVHCDIAEFDVESDGYKQQSLEGDAWRQAPLIFARLCTKSRDTAEKDS